MKMGNINMKNDPKVSIVIPVLNEKDNIKILVNELLGLPINIQQIIFVDDGSTDDTAAQIKLLSRSDSRIQFISFSKNFGHQAALKAGFDHANGDCVVTMDGDMQHPPEIIPRMLSIWQSGADVVQARRLHEPCLPLFKKFSSKLFYAILNILSPVHIEAGTADFRLLDARIVELCKNFSENALFWRGLIPWLGFNQQFIDYTPRQRFYGRSKYSLKKMLRLALDGIVSFSILPLRFAFMTGLIVLLMCFFYIVYVVIMAISGLSVAGWSSLMCVILALGGFQLIFLGIIGEYIGKIFFQSKQRYIYVIKEKSGGL